MPLFHTDDTSNDVYRQIQSSLEVVMFWFSNRLDAKLLEGEIC
jgi:hypothetical protein